MPGIRNIMVPTISSLPARESSRPMWACAWRPLRSAVAMCSRWLASLTSVLPYPTISSSTRRVALGSLERMITLSFEEANIEQEVCSRQAQRVRAIIFFMAYGGGGMCDYEFTRMIAMMSMSVSAIRRQPVSAVLRG